MIHYSINPAQPTKPIYQVSVLVSPNLQRTVADITKLPDFLRRDG